MSDAHNIFVLLNYISVFVMLASFIVLANQTASHMQKLAMGTIFSLLVCCIGFLFRIEATSVEGLILGQKLVYSFVTFGMYYMLRFIIDYCEYRVRRWAVLLFGCINALITIAVLTLDHHQLFYKSYWAVEENGYLSLEKEYGFLHTVAIALFGFYMLSALVISVIYFIQNAKRKRAYVRRLLIAIALPCLSYVIPKILDMKNDLQPIAFAAFTVIVLFMIYKQNLYDVDNIAASYAAQTQEEAMIVLDDKDRLQGCNQLAKDLIPELKELKLDDNLYGASDILDGIIGESTNNNLFNPAKNAGGISGGATVDIGIGDRIFEVVISPVNDADDRLVGKVIRLKDETVNRRYTAMLKSRQESLSSQVEELSNISYTDDLTGCFNRRKYEEDVKDIRDAKTEGNVIVWAFDLNGLKITNDTKGHAAGDELIKMTVSILNEVFGGYGEVYRTGGDEFFVIMKNQTADNEKLATTLESLCSCRKGELIDNVHLAYGYVSGKDNANLNIDELMLIVDKNMYENKRRYYESAGIDRRA